MSDYLMSDYLMSDYLMSVLPVLMVCDKSPISIAIGSSHASFALCSIDTVHHAALTTQ